ncbi:MAG: H-NS histone family protein [Rhodoferax sp.]|uniref:H-NS histone family protein n=1 Tax=Rhodoferax sp. TaxID=50421 RepID=UPI002607C0C8|nr:H-NS histone family protein [Rhodoferax sp.]MDD2882943.1 H-NS histone family protein [Rhodoferax sp.]
MSTLSEIEAQIAELTAKADQMRLEQHSKAVSDAQAIINSFNLKASDLVFCSDKDKVEKSAKSVSVKSSKKAEIKYRDDNGNTWSGRGLKPRWLTAELEIGKSLSNFLVQPVLA